MKIFDTSYLRGLNAACGKIQSFFIDGKCLTIDPKTKPILSEFE